MALLHQATLQPSKLDLLSGYLNVGALTQLGSYRFDDPDGQVGIETHLVADSSGAVLHLPLTYRNEPLAGIDEWGVGTIEHSVLGTRWVYNACADPVYAAQLIRAILTGGTQVEQYFESNGERLYREPTATVVGSGQRAEGHARSQDHRRTRRVLRCRHPDRRRRSAGGRAPQPRHA